MPTWKDTPLVSKPDPHLADDSPWRKKRTGRVLRRATYRDRPRGKLGFILRAIVLTALSAVFACVLLAYGQPYMDTYVKPYMEKIRAELGD